MTQEQLAERSGIAVRTIRRLETGAPTDPRIGTMKRLANALDLAPDEHRKLLAAFAGNATPDDIDDAPSLATGPASPDALADLMHEVRGRYRRAEEQRRINDPIPLPVCWQPAPTELTDHVDNIRRVAAGATAGPLNLAGALDSLAGSYRQIPSGRLVVLGRAGSGKTVLMLRFVLNYLETRTAAEPVPVIFSLGSWDPTTTELRDWLTAQLLRDYPSLVANAPGRSSQAAALVETGRILPVLDGFDEIAQGLRRDALDALRPTPLPLLLTRPTAEYRKVVAASNVLTSAAGIELVDLTPTDLINYLPRTTRLPVWDRVLDELRDRPDTPASVNLAAALSTPLMVVLARAVYRDTPGYHPDILLNTT